MHPGKGNRTTRNAGREQGRRVPERQTERLRKSPEDIALPWKQAHGGWGGGRLLGRPGHPGTLMQRRAVGPSREVWQARAPWSWSPTARPCSPLGSSPTWEDSHEGLVAPRCSVAVGARTDGRHPGHAVEHWAAVRAAEGPCSAGLCGCGLNILHQPRPTRCSGPPPLRRWRGQTLRIFSASATLLVSAFSQKSQRRTNAEGMT